MAAIKIARQESKREAKTSNLIKSLTFVNLFIN